MIKGFHTLIRLHQWRVDEKRRALGSLLGKARDLENAAAKHEESVTNERLVAASDPAGAGRYYGAYAAAAVDKRYALATERAEVELEILKAQDQVREEFRGLKVFELSQEARDREEEAELAKDEQATLDEIGLENYRRHK